jgi:general secretion pathway protein G
VGSWNGPYLKGQGIPQDPWSHLYVYRNPSTRAGRDYDLCSTGPGGNASGDQGLICNP